MPHGSGNRQTKSQIIAVSWRFKSGIGFIGGTTFEFDDALNGNDFETRSKTTILTKHWNKRSARAITHNAQEKFMISSCSSKQFHWEIYFHRFRGGFFHQCSCIIVAHSISHDKTKWMGCSSIHLPVHVDCRHFNVAFCLLGQKLCSLKNSEYNEFGESLSKRQSGWIQLFVSASPKKEKKTQNQWNCSTIKFICHTYRTRAVWWRFSYICQGLSRCRVIASRNKAKSHYLATKHALRILLLLFERNHFLFTQLIFVVLLLIIQLGSVSTNSTYNTIVTTEIIIIKKWERENEKERTCCSN